MRFCRIYKTTTGVFLGYFFVLNLFEAAFQLSSLKKKKKKKKKKNLNSHEDMSEKLIVWLLIILQS